MKISRFTRLLTAIVALLSMLSMQLAVASYVCPGTLAGGQTDLAAPQLTMTDMANCQGMDPGQPQLCDLHTHGEPAKQPLDKPATANVPPFVPSALILQLQHIDAGLNACAPSDRPLALARTTAPPLTIRNCCFRI